jgi:hypothetical protein
MSKNSNMKQSNEIQNNLRNENPLESIKLKSTNNSMV